MLISYLTIFYLLYTHQKTEKSIMEIESSYLSTYFYIMKSIAKWF